MKHEKPSRAKIADGQISATFDRLALTEAVTTAASLEECRVGASIPILSYLVVGPDAIEYRGLDTSLRVRLDGSSGSGRVMLPARSLSGALAAMPDETVVVEKSADASDVTITCGDVVATFVPLCVADTPAPLEVSPPNDANLRSFALGEGALAGLLGFVSSFISDCETRYYLNGVSLTCEERPDGPYLVVVATDGHRLASCSAGLPAPCEGFQKRIVPRAAALFLKAHVGRRETRIRISQNRAEFAFGDAIFATKLIDGVFPDYSRVVPQPLNAGRTIDAKALGRFLAAARVVFGWRGRYEMPVKFEPSDDDLKVSGRGSDKGSMAVALRAEVDGEPVTTPIGFNPIYLSKVVKAFGSKRLRLEYAGSFDPCRVTDPDRLGDDFALLMPMRL